MVHTRPLLTAFAVGLLVVLTALGGAVHWNAPLSGL